jgi:hypothetical protein
MVRDKTKKAKKKEKAKPESWDLVDWYDTFWLK